MAEHDDIAASLPRPPPPSPARRDQAIEMAMRRFDGEEPAGSAPAGKRAASGWWPRLTRPQVGVFITLVIVAAVGLPLAWQSWTQWPSVPPAQISKNQAEPQPAAREASRSVSVAAPKQPGSVVPTNAPTSDKNAPVAASKPVSSARVESPQAARAPVAQLAPPPPSGESDEAVVSGRRREEAMANVPTSVVAVPEEQHRKVSERDEERDSANIIVTARRRTDAIGRGDWNACTVNDPDQSLKKCKSLTRSDKKPDRGRAAASIADGISLAWNGDLDEAIAAFDRAIALAPRNASAYLNRGMAYQRKGDLDRAIADFNQAVRNDPGSARGYYNRSLALRAKGNEPRARSDEQRAIEIDPNYADAVR